MAAVTAAGITDNGTFYPWATISKVEREGRYSSNAEVWFADGTFRTLIGLWDALKEYEAQSKQGG